MADTDRRSARAWRDLAYRAIPAFVSARGGAVVWPEVEALLSNRKGWLRDHAPEIQANSFDPHILGVARDLLVEADILTPQRVLLQDREVTSYVESAAYKERRATRVDRLAAQKRRRYRSLLGWTSDAKLCGQIAERHMAATLEELKGVAIWLPHGSREVRELDGQRITGGLDHAGHISLDPAHPGTGGWVPFVVEDKNVRQRIYPYHIEVWDLICKAAAFPTHVPILIAPRLHYTTFRLFRAIGAIGVPTTRQWFAPHPAIPTAKFTGAVGPLGLRGDAAQLLNPDSPSGQLHDFFTKTIHQLDAANPSDGSLIERSQKLWLRAAPILSNPEFAQLRRHDLADRRGTYRKALDELYADGLDVEALLPRHVVYPDDADADEDVAWTAYVDPDDWPDSSG